MIWLALILAFFAGAGVKEILNPLGTRKSIHAVVTTIYVITSILIVINYT